MKLYIFRTVPLSIIRSHSLYTQQLYMSYSFVDSLSSRSILVLLESCLQTCMTYIQARIYARAPGAWAQGGKF